MAAPSERKLFWLAADQPAVLLQLKTWLATDAKAPIDADLSAIMRACVAAIGEWVNAPDADEFFEAVKRESSPEALSRGRIPRNYYFWPKEKAELLRLKLVAAERGIFADEAALIRVMVDRLGGWLRDRETRPLNHFASLVARTLNPDRGHRSGRVPYLPAGAVEPEAEAAAAAERKKPHDLRKPRQKTK